MSISLSPLTLTLPSRVRKIEKTINNDQDTSVVLRASCPGEVASLISCAKLQLLTRFSERVSMVDLSDNGIGNEGCYRLARAFSSSSFSRLPEVLILRNNRIEKEGIGSLVLALHGRFQKREEEEKEQQRKAEASGKLEEEEKAAERSVESLKQLDLARNRIGSEGLVLIAEYLQDVGLT